MTNKYSLKEIEDYTSNIDKIKSLDEINPVLFSHSIKYFADNKDENNFKKMIDKYLQLVKDSPNEDIKENIYSFLEFICSGMDRGFTNTFLEKGEPGNTENMMKRLYGNQKK